MAWTVAVVVVHVKPDGGRKFMMEMSWHFLAISARVIAVSLFATVNVYWFAGLLAAQAIIVTVVAVIMGAEFWSPLIGCASVFTLIIPLDTKWAAAVTVYWIAMSIENITLISLWFVANDGMGLWYHNAAISYVIPAYFLAFVVKGSSFCMGTLKAKPESSGGVRECQGGMTPSPESSE